MLGFLNSIPGCTTDLMECSHCREFHKAVDMNRVMVGDNVELWCNHCAAAYAIRCHDCGNLVYRRYITIDLDEEKPVPRCRYCYDKAFRITDRERKEKRVGRFAKKNAKGEIMQLYAYHEYDNLIPPEKLWRTRIANDDGSPNDEYNDLLPSNTKIKELDCPLLGVELEMSGAGLNARKAYEISKVMGFPTTVSTELKFSRDGSLPDGLEVISMPGNLNYHAKVVDWENGMKKAAALGYRSHDTGICGLHVHVNRSFFNETQEIVEDKLTTFIYNNSEWIKKFSRRINFDYCRFVHKAHAQNSTLNLLNNDVNTEDDWRKLKEGFRELDSAKNFNYDHHSAVSFTPNKTIEFRFFRGTLVYKTFIAALQLVTIICKIIRNSTLKETEQIRLKHIIQNAKKLHYNELIDYINERKCKDFGPKVFKVMNEDFDLTEQHVDKSEKISDVQNEDAFLF